MSKRPVKKFKARGGLSVSVWENPFTKGNQTFTRHNATIEKRYRDKDGNWRSTNTLFSEDCKKLSCLLNKASEFMDQVQEENPEDTSFDPEQLEQDAG